MGPPGRLGYGGTTKHTNDTKAVGPRMILIPRMERVHYGADQPIMMPDSFPFLNDEFPNDKHSPTDYLAAMSKAEILQELPKLTKEERHEIRVTIAEMDNDGWLDEDDPLTDQDKALLEARLEDLEKHPEKSIPWSEAEARLKARFGE